MGPYQHLATALVSDGIRCQFHRPGQMVVSDQVGLIWPNRGNSFWVTHARGRWHLFTWVPIGYQVPEAADMAALCRACIEYGDSAMAVVPPHISRQFGLRELTDEDAEQVYDEMDRPG